MSGSVYDDGAPAPSAHPCVGMTTRAVEVFEQIAIGNDVGHPPRVVQSLLGRNLIEQHGERRPLFEHRPGGPQITVHRYSVPMVVHMEWCIWCNENVSDDEIEGGA